MPHKNVSPHALFQGLDRARFVSAFAGRLRYVGMDTPLSSLESFANALEAAGAISKGDLYWLTRISFVKRREDLAVFDQVFAAVFDFELNRTGKQARRAPRQGKSEVKSSGTVLQRLPVLVDGEASSGDGLPWASPPSISDTPEDDDNEDSTTELAERLPSIDPSQADRPFDQLSEDDLLAMCRALERARWEWPQRRSRRMVRTNKSGRPSMRRTIRHASRNGGEVTQIVSVRARRSPRRVVMLVDVSGSMESYVRAYLHTCRVLVERGHMEVFAVGTDLHRLTPALHHRSAAEAMELATEAVGDRFGGTKLASSIGQLIRHRLWGRFVRGSVVLIASDGWDTDPPAQMAREMERLQRRAHSVIWMNPRTAAAGYEPLVASMAAAMPFCDEVLSGHSANAMLDVMDAIAAG